MFARMAADWKCEGCGGDELPGRLKVRRVEGRLRAECRRCAPVAATPPARTQAALFVALEENELPQGQPKDLTPKPRYRRPGRHASLTE